MRARRLLIILLAVALVAPLDLGALAPAASAGGRTRPLVWVALEGAGQIALVDVETGDVLRRRRAPGGPHNITVARDGTVAVALWQSDRIGILRPGRGMRFVRLGGAPHDIKARGRLFVVANQGDARIDRVRRTGGRKASIQLRADPHDLAISPNGDRAWVSLEGSDDLAVVDLESRRVRYVSTGQRPHDLLFAPNSRLWVTDWRGALHVFRGDRRVRSLRLGREAHHLAFTPDGREAWITDHGRDRVYIVSIRRIRRIDTRRIPGSPHHVAITADGKWAVVADHDRGTLVVFDAQNHRRVRTIRVGRGPHAVWAVPG